jgi:hypothetical protein
VPLLLDAGMRGTFAVTLKKRRKTVGHKGIAIAAGLVSLVVASQATAQTNRFTTQDATVLDALSRRIQQAQKENLNLSRSLNRSQSFECLKDVNSNISDLDHRLIFISTLVYISSQMRAADDLDTVNGSLRTELKHALRSLSVDRKGVNIAVSGCDAVAVVISRAQVALAFFDEVERALSLLNHRL